MEFTININTVIGTFVLGAIGAAILEFYRFIRIGRQGLKINKGYFIVSGIHVVVGGIVSLVLVGNLPWSALFVGIAVPMIVSAFAGKSLDELIRSDDNTASAMKEYRRIEYLDEIGKDFNEYVTTNDLDLRTISKVTEAWDEFEKNQVAAFEIRYERYFGRGSGTDELFFNLTGYRHFLFSVFDRGPDYRDMDL